MPGLRSLLGLLVLMLWGCGVLGLSVPRPDQHGQRSQNAKRSVPQPHELTGTGEVERRAFDDGRRHEKRRTPPASGGSPSYFNLVWGKKPPKTQQGKLYRTASGYLVDQDGNIVTEEMPAPDPGTHNGYTNGAPSTANGGQVSSQWYKPWSWGSSSSAPEKPAEKMIWDTQTGGFIPASQLSSGEFSRQENIPSSSGSTGSSGSSSLWTENPPSAGGAQSEVPVGTGVSPEQQHVPPENLPGPSESEAAPSGTQPRPSEIQPDVPGTGNSPSAEEPADDSDPNAEYPTEPDSDTGSVGEPVPVGEPAPAVESPSTGSTAPGPKKKGCKKLFNKLGKFLGCAREPKTVDGVPSPPAPATPSKQPVPEGLNRTVHYRVDCDVNSPNQSRQSMGGGLWALVDRCFPSLWISAGPVDEPLWLGFNEYFGRDMIGKVKPEDVLSVTEYPNLANEKYVLPTKAKVEVQRPYRIWSKALWQMPHRNEFFFDPKTGRGIFRDFAMPKRDRETQIFSRFEYIQLFAKLFFVNSEIEPGEAAKAFDLDFDYWDQTLGSSTGEVDVTHLKWTSDWVDLATGQRDPNREIEKRKWAVWTKPEPTLVMTLRTHDINQEEPAAAGGTSETGASDVSGGAAGAVTENDPAAGSSGVPQDDVAAAGANPVAGPGNSAASENSAGSLPEGSPIAGPSGPQSSNPQPGPSGELPVSNPLSGPAGSRGSNGIPGAGVGGSVSEIEPAPLPSSKTSKWKTWRDRLTPGRKQNTVPPTGSTPP
ncbi:MAG: hypothetical protein M1833_001796 [Piccolia ochrophora]|nr:MAG: hypothetical protein M1833_001796 [Piccolia ochrophora]